MLELKKIAITGGVASGKSSVCRFFQELGAFVVNADALVHELLKSDTDLSQQVIQQFGPEISKDGQIDRGALADLVFKNPSKLKKLEELLHPRVLRKIEELYVAACNEGSYLCFVVEIPLLFEIGAESFYDVAIAVLSDEATARQRFIQEGFRETEYDLRMKRHLKPNQKAAKAHYILINQGSLEDLRREVIRLNHIIQNL